jgi:hypothetical protein
MPQKEEIAHSAMGQTEKWFWQTLLETNTLRFCGDTFEHQRSFWI